MLKIRKMLTGSPLYYNQKYITPTFLGKSMLQIANEYLIALKRYKDEQFAKAAANRVEPQLTSDNRSTWQRLQDLKMALLAAKKEQEVKNQEAAGKAATGLLAMATPSTYAGFAMGNMSGTGTGSSALDLLIDTGTFGGPSLLKNLLNNNLKNVIKYLKYIKGIYTPEYVKNYINRSLKPNPYVDIKDVKIGELESPFLEGFIPLVTSTVGPRNKRFALGMLQRLEDQGYNIYQAVPFSEKGSTTLRSPLKYITERMEKPVYIGYYPNNGSPAGHFEVLTGRSAIDPSIDTNNVPSTILHEGIMHPTDDLIEALEKYHGGNVLSMYKDFVKNLFIEKDGTKYKIASNLKSNPDGTYTVINPGKTTHGYKTTGGSEKWYEARATIGEMRRKLELEFENLNPKFKGMSPDMLDYQEAFNKYINSYDNNNLIAMLTNETNSYGNTYGVLHKNNPNFYLDLKNILKYGASYGIPITIGSLQSKKQGGMLQLLKKGGSGIHIKEKNKGSFTRWCGGNVTDECIRKGKASSNPKIRKKATFADNARHFKHKLGGLIKKAQEGTKFDWGLLASTGVNLLNSYLNTKASNKETDSNYLTQVASLELERSLKNKNVPYYALMIASKMQKDVDPENPNAYAGIPSQILPYKIADYLLSQNDKEYNDKIKALEMRSQLLKNLSNTNFWMGAAQEGLGLLMNNIGKKGTSNTSFNSGNLSSGTTLLTNSSININNQYSLMNQNPQYWTSKYSTLK